MPRRSAVVMRQIVGLGTIRETTVTMAVQVAVDQGGDIVLQGHFSFNRPPTVPTATALAGGLLTVLVSKAVRISGGRDENGDMRDENGAMTSIEGGRLPSMSKLREPASRFRDCVLSAQKGTRFLFMRSAG
jgi:hypothetical protein